jgi:hypothetical protein
MSCQVCARIDACVSLLICTIGGTALDGSDNNSRMEDWDEDLEGHLDVDKIRLQLKAVHFANLPLSPVPSDESTTSSKQVRSHIH